MTQHLVPHRSYNVLYEVSLPEYDAYQVASDPDEADDSLDDLRDEIAEKIEGEVRSQSSAHDATPPAGFDPAAPFDNPDFHRLFHDLKHNEVVDSGLDSHSLKLLLCYVVDELRS